MTSELIYECLRGNLKAVKKLIDNETEPNLNYGDIERALEESCIYGHIEIIKLLLNHYGNLKIPDGFYMINLQKSFYFGVSSINTLKLQNYFFQTNILKEFIMKMKITYFVMHVDMVT